MRFALLVAVALLAGCGTVPAWAPLVTAGLGFGASALHFDDDIFNYVTAKKTPPPPAEPYQP